MPQKTLAHTLAACETVYVNYGHAICGKSTELDIQALIDRLVIKAQSSWDGSLRPPIEVAAYLSSSDGSAIKFRHFWDCWKPATSY